MTTSVRLFLALTLVSLGPLPAYPSTDSLAGTTTANLEVPTPAPANVSGARPVPEEITRNLHGWDKGAAWLHFLQIVLSLAAIVSSLLVAVHFGPSRILRVLAVCSALFTGLVSAFDPGGEANRMRNAWRVLNAALLRYQAGETGVDKVIDAYERGETIIGSYTVSLNTQGAQDNKDRQAEGLPSPNPPEDH